MKSIFITANCAAAVLFAGLTSVSAYDNSKQHLLTKHYGTSAGIRVENAWARATPGFSKNGGAYFTIRNSGKDEDRIVGVYAAISQKAEIHVHLNDKDIMRMLRVQSVDVPAGGKTVFEPGGRHIMLIGLHKPLKKGESFPLTLKFEKAGKKSFRVIVTGVGAMKSGLKHEMKEEAKGAMKPKHGIHGVK